MNKIRKIPPVCLCVALVNFLTGKLKLSKEYLETEFINKQGNVFKIFRNVVYKKQDSSHETIVFIVSFKFAHLSHRTNKMVSLIPMLLIAGFPGFVQKMYAVNEESGYWQGIYEWKAKQHLEAYKKSFVFRMMKNRALPKSIQEKEYVE